MTEYAITDAERLRIDRIDTLLVLGAGGVSELVAALSDPSWTVRRATVAALAAAGDDAATALGRWLADARTSEHAIAAAVDALAASIGAAASATAAGLLDHGNPAVIADGAQILGRRRAAEAAPALERLLAHTDDNVALAAIDALGAIGAASSVEPLIAVLGGASFFRTFAALQVLPRTGDPRVVAPLAALLASPSFQREAIDALGRTGSPLAITPLARALEEPALLGPTLAAFSALLARAEWTGAADAAIAELRVAVRPALDRVVAALREAPHDERAAIASLLGRIGNPTVLPALTGLLDDAAIATIAAEAIGAIGQRAAPIRVASSVIPMLADENPDLRARACDALARIGDTSAVGPLFELLGDPNLRVAHAATAAIQSLGSDETTTRTLAALAATAPAVRRQALRIVAYLGTPAAFDAAHAATADPDRRLGELAVIALGAIDDPRSSAALVELAASPHEALRAAAMRAIAQRADPDAPALLERGLGDPAAWVRYYAAQGLGRLGAGGALLIARLADPAPHVRLAAVEALAHANTPAAWEALRATAASSDPDERRAALVGIGLHPRDGALDYLLEAARAAESATRLIALSGLARRPEPAALATLADAARSDTPEIAEAALSLLAEREDRAAAELVVDLALASPPEHAAHRALSQPARLDAIAARLRSSDDRATAALVAALARMRAIPALVNALALDRPTVRRLAATALFASGAPDARARLAALAASDPDPDVRRACAAAIAAG